MVEYLTIHDEEYPVRIGYYVMKRVKEETGKEFSEALDGIDEDNMDLHETILYAALEQGAYAQNGSKDIDFDREEMPMVLDMVLVEYMELFSSDSFFPTEVQDKIEKKKLSRGENGEKKKPKRTKEKKKKQT